MKKLSLFAVAALMLLGVVSCSKYETVKGDPMKVKIYTLDNGLKVYMSVNKEQPRLQTYIAVRNGGKNDPSDNTGLAHYLTRLKSSSISIAPRPILRSALQSIMLLTA